MAPVTYAIPGEILSPADKTIGMSFGQAVFMLSTTVLLKVRLEYVVSLCVSMCQVYPMLVEILGYAILFILHSVILVMATLFVFRYHLHTYTHPHSGHP